MTNAVGMEFVLIRPGSMVVGRFQPECPKPPAKPPEGDPRAAWNADDYRRCAEMAKRDATPGISVRIARPYYIGKYEVTQAEWTRVMGANPSVFKGDRRPVDNVTWDDAQAFVRKLDSLDTTAHYRLPTEFEWEWAARAGADSEPSWPQIRASAWEQEIDKGTTHDVGGKAPNAWGLYDTLGNVWEWVEDVYNEKTFPDATPPSRGTTHVLRGGSFLSDVKNATWFTHAGGPGSGFDVGFRVVREVR
jgi:formylglycine-generating enzyme required for sulfatase activity